MLIELKPESKSVYGGRWALNKFTHASYRRVYVSTVVFLESVRKNAIGKK